MKQLLFFALSFVLIGNGCKKKKDEEPQLPPETTTGAYTFGCKINGKVFVPRGGRGQPGLFAQYVDLGTGARGGWFLNISATDWRSSGLPSMGIETDSLLLKESNVYILKKRKGFAFSAYSAGYNQYGMLPIDTGQLTITKHDLNSRILAGKFWFTATSASGEKVDIREGRFDIVY